MGILTEISAFAIFLGIAAVGFLFLIVSLVFGEIFDAFGGDDMDFGGHDFDADADHGPGFFSPRVLSVFATAFGGIGAVAVNSGASTPVATGIGFVGGMVFGGMMYAFARFLYSQQATTEVRSSDLAGQTARVVVAIPAGGVGQIRCRLGEQVIDKIARTGDGQPVAENKQVLVEEVLGDVVIVREHQAS